MSPTRVSIDFGQNPIQVGCLTLGKYLVSRGSKGITANNIVGVKQDEVVACFRDATDVVKSYYGASKIDAAVVVVINSLQVDIREKIRTYGEGSGFKVPQVVEERVAVAVAYTEKAKPTGKTNLAIVSLSADIIDVSIISLSREPGPAVEYSYYLQFHSASPVPAGFGKQESGSGGGLFGLVEGAAETLVEDPFQAVVGAINKILGDPKLDGVGNVDKVIFVGNAASSEILRSEAATKFYGSEVWSEFADAADIAAYGAAVISHNDARITLNKKGDLQPSAFEGGPVM